MLGRRRWWEFAMPWSNPYSDWRMRHRGRQDAKSQPPIPAWDAEALPPSLKMLSQAGNQDLRALAKDWHEEDRRYKTAWTLASSALEGAEKATLNAREKADLALDQFELTHGHRLAVLPSSRRYMALVALLCIFEFPLNALVFRGFGESELFTWLMAFGFGVCFTLCAHYLGKLLREKRSALRVGMCILLALLPSAAIIGVATLRAEYLTARAGDLSVWSIGVLIPFFIAWNFILYAVAMIASYRHHEPFRAEIAATQRELDRTERERNRSQETMNEAEVRREKKFAEKQEHAAWIHEEARRLGSLYWTINLRARADLGDQHGDSFPKGYSRDLDVVMPEELQRLLWDRGPALHPPASDADRSIMAKNLVLLPGNTSVETHNEISRGY